jgi:hypothetical protein
VFHYATPIFIQLKVVKPLFQPKNGKHLKWRAAFFPSALFWLPLANTGKAMILFLFVRIAKICLIAPVKYFAT